MHYADLDHVTDTMHATGGLTPSYTPGALRALHALGSGPCAP